MLESVNTIEDHLLVCKYLILLGNKIHFIYVQKCVQDLIPSIPNFRDMNIRKNGL